jgi:threonine dehydratase
MSVQLQRAELARQYPEAYVASAYDDPFVIDGNSSLGREIGGLQIPCNEVIVPVSGGGLSSGVIVGLRAGGCAARR